ncbi:MAG: glycosyltransferase family 2 protein [Pedobacter sp.]|nr:glycosyltransferase family 2 protein [Pedobacter sp.]
MRLPLVSCIMPTADREKFIPYAISYFLQQNYPHKELIIIDDGKYAIKPLVPKHPQIKYFFSEPLGTIGLKRNYACEKASGEIIMHWDDDDWHAYDWIMKQVYFLQSSGADICGIRHVHYFSAIMNMFWQGDANNRNNPDSRVWLNGATLAYWKVFWQKHHFQDLQKGEDDAFIQSEGAKVFAHDYIDGFIAILHPDNTTVKSFENKKHKKNT